MTERDDILATLDAYAEAYCSKDLDGLMSVFLDGEDISLIGTGSDELCSGRSAVRAVFERNFADATALKFEWGWKSIHVHGNAGTVAITLLIHLQANGKPLQVPVRWTVSLVKTPTGWRWVNRHASVASKTQKTGSAYPGAEK